MQPNKTGWKLLVGILALATVAGLLFVARKSFVDSAPPPLTHRTADRLGAAAAPLPASHEPANRNAASDKDPANSRRPAPSGIFLTPEARWKEPIREAAFARFHDWVERYSNAPSAQARSERLPEGVQLAENRRSALRELIQSDPERALQLTVPISVRRSLPSPVSDLLEDRVSGRGALAVLAALAEPGREQEVVPVFRKATVGDRTYDAFVYGRREGEPTRWKTTLHGIAVDNLLAVHEERVRVLEPEEGAEQEAQAAEAICSFSGQIASINNEATAVEVGGQVRFLCGANHIQALNEKLIAAEGDGAATDPAADPEVEASAWSEGQKKLILIRVDFPDLPGPSFSDSSGTNLIVGLNSFYSEMSYGKTGFAPVGGGSDFTPTFRMPQPASWYGTNNYYNQLRTDARNAATAAGYVLANYNLDVTCMGAVTGFGWSGLAYVGSAGAWIRGTSSTGVTAHELGHNYGLNHASFWDTAGASVTGPGTSVEYGDSFDTMGAASAGNNHFNARYKSYLNWLTTNDTISVTASGNYRIFAHDSATATGMRGLKIVKNSGTNYWVEFRQKFTANKWLMNGAGLRWAQSGNQRSLLLDTTPGSTDGKTDSAIVIGRTFSDRQSGIHITPVGKGGTVPESLDVVVNLGTFPANVPPTAALLANVTNAAIGVTLAFSADAADANGDVLAYYWDFGDGNFGTNGPNATRSWSAAGDYVVRCTVTDMKGGTASDSVIVTIGSPATYRLSGRVATAADEPVQNVRLYVSSTRMTYADSDGTYNLVGLPAGTYTVNASLESYTFGLSGFSNPVTVGPNRTGLNFIAADSTNVAPSISTQPVSQAVSPGATVAFSVTVTGSSPMAYQWRFNSANISGATGSSYTKSNVQSADAGNYSVVVSNSAGTATSANAVLTVNAPPAITAQPQSLAVIAGSSAPFSVTASGSPLAYQWRHNGTNIPGATAGSYSRLDAQPVHGGYYTVVITNAIGSVTSAPAALTVNYALYASATAGGSVAKNPDQASYAPGSTVTLTAVSDSSFPFAGWSGDATGTNNPLTVTLNTNLTIGANFVSPVADLIVDNPQAAFTGTWTTGTTATNKYATDYRTASSAPGGVSATTTFTPNFAAAGRYDVYVWFPTITKGAPNAPFVVSSSEGATTVSANQSSGSGGWRLLALGKLFAQGTNGFVRLANNTGQGGKTVVADAVRWAYSPNQDSPLPTITTQPSDVSVVAGSPATFSVAADGAAPLSFQWRHDGSNLAGATNDILILSSVRALDEGNYTVVIADSVNSVTSVVATLTVLVPPAVASQPTNQTVVAGDDASFAVEATGTQPMSYQWQLSGEDLPGATNDTLHLAEVQPVEAGGYRVVVGNAVGAVTSLVATLTVLLPPQILDPPQSREALAGDSVTFSVTVSGTAPFKFQWRRNGGDLAGATNDVLNLPQVQPANEGDYTVVVSNFVGSVASEVATLTLLAPPLITRQPTNQTLIAGDDASFSVAAAGAQPMNYQWRFNGADVPAWTNATLELAGVEAAHAGSYSVVVSNVAGAVTSSLATLTVLEPPQILSPPEPLRVLENTPAGFTVEAIGAAVLRYQWRRDATEIPGATNSAFTLAAAQAGDAGDYDVMVSNSAGSATSAPAALVVSVRPRFDTPRLLSNGTPQVWLYGTPGDAYAMEMSLNGMTWTPGAIVTNLTGSVQFTDESAGSSSQRFYRARLVP